MTKQEQLLDATNQYITNRLEGDKEVPTMSEIKAFIQEYKEVLLAC